MAVTTTDVYADWSPIAEPLNMGKLSYTPVRNNGVFDFTYSSEFLASAHRLKLDPMLELVRGNQYNDKSGHNFRAFLDSSPDRWGRLLMQRRAAIEKRKGQREHDRLTELDYLLDVHDQNRMGGLRFKSDVSGNWLDNNLRLSAPPIASLAELEYAAMQIENEPDIDSDEYQKWLYMLISPGSSLGGARPKACVKDNDGLWIAKFPNHTDTDDVAAWEYVCHLLALEAGIEMAPCRIQRLNSPYHTFLTKRFDRTGDIRHHFSSAMTQLKYYDGDEGASYLDMAEFITNAGARTASDLQQLWRRLVFNIAVSNTDDHLRNHGFMLADKGWVLSPAYDINPNPDKPGLHLNITDTNNSLDYALAFEVAEFFRLTPNQATTIYDDVLKAVSQWQVIAKQVGLSANSTKLKASAFRI
ncbi:HipA domain-containing protein [Paraglaciecola sp.]|uniref:type II toxin-antitoxin system HipA family toxin n=1 Tax=Paraglaciecola sp. TaxID=1920173 RepID=UPI0030F42E61